MNEKQKMLSGELYNANDEELVNDRKNAELFCFEYNCLNSSERDKKNKCSKIKYWFK